MFGERRFRWLLATATVTAAVTVAGASASGALSSPVHRPYLNAPGLRARTAAATPTVTNPCGFQASVLADSFKGIPVFNATQEGSLSTSPSSPREASSLSGC
jgi:peptidyl-prolyl cis-trans isomerase B (cyclophilin B)